MHQLLYILNKVFGTHSWNPFGFFNFQLGIKESVDNFKTLFNIITLLQKQLKDKNNQIDELNLRVVHLKDEHVEPQNRVEELEQY